MTPPWVVCAPMRIEAAALRRGLVASANRERGRAVSGSRERGPDASDSRERGLGGSASGRGPKDAVRHTGVGARRAGQAAAGLDRSGLAAFAVAGVAGGLRAALRAGDVVVADRVRTVDGSIAVECPAAPLVASALRRRGMTVHIGPVVSADHLVRGAFRQRLAATGALAADTESAWLLGGVGVGTVALACVRVVADAPPGAVFQPATLGRLATALRALPRVASALAEFAEAATVRRVVPAAEADVVLVPGSTNSANSRRLVEVAARAGTVAHLVDDVHAIDLRWLAGARTVGVTAGACAPSALVDDVVAALRGLGAGDVVERTDTRRGAEPNRSGAPPAGDVRFTLPKEVRQS